MINYDPKRWWLVLLSFPRSPVFTTLLLDVIGVGIYAGLVVWVQERLGFEAPLGPQILSLLGIILGLLLVFRTNTAYDRWWEEVLPAMENENVVGPAVNPFKELYWNQFGRGQ